MLVLVALSSTSLYTARTMESKTHYIKNTIQNFSSYQLSINEYTAVLYGLDHHIPTRLNNNRIHTE